MHVAPGNPGPQPSKASPPPLPATKSAGESAPGQQLTGHGVGWLWATPPPLCSCGAPRLGCSPASGRQRASHFISEDLQPPPGTVVGEGHLSCQRPAGRADPPPPCFCFQTFWNPVYLGSLLPAYLLMVAMAVWAYHLSGGSKKNLQHFLLCECPSSSCPRPPQVPLPTGQLPLG